MAENASVLLRKDIMPENFSDRVNSFRYTRAAQNGSPLLSVDRAIIALAEFALNQLGKKQEIRK